MTSRPAPKDGRERAREYRERMRAKGYRQVTLWVPDTRTPEFAAESRRQSLLVAASIHEQEDIDFVDSLR